MRTGHRSRRADMETTSQRRTFETVFREHLKAKRIALGRTQKDVARRAREFGFDEAHQPTIARIERGDRAIGLDEAAALARAVETPLIDMLWSGNSAPNNEAARSIRESEKDALMAALQSENDEN